ncbi:MAG: ATP phosphoribosyltransferase regulatory subunit [Alphaproteobacteria bacterium]|nr:ATP phosphoribosyltransferase regulatory subunit [Alphaproteobacteria bacterium]
MSENITKQKLEAVRGMRDFLPADWVFRDKLMTIWNKVAADRGFSKYETPIVENLELFVRKAGEEISEQIYAFQDKSERELALRPEITPSMVRIFTSNREAFPSSGKIYSIGQCFRYERTTRGRKREHFQWNIDIIGEKSPAAEAWLIASAVNVMTELGFTADDFKVRVNSREIITDYLSKIGVSEDLFNDVFILMDKKEKVEKSYLMEEFAKVGLSTEQAESLYAFMEIKGLEDLAAFADT